MSEISKKKPLLALLALVIVILCLALPTADFVSPRNPASSQLALPAVGHWNGFLEHLGVAECLSLAEGSQSLLLTLLDGQRHALTDTVLALENFNSIHSILQHPALSNNYGTYELTSPEQASEVAAYCQTLTYRGIGDGLEYVFSIPVVESLRGDSYGLYNSYNPVGPASQPVFNWLSIVNTGQENFSAIIKTFPQEGGLQALTTERISNLAPGEKRDFALGHPHGMQVGTYLIAPLNEEAEYQAHLSRYSQRADGSFAFAYPLSAVYGSDSPETLFASTMGSALNWGTIGNVAPRSEEIEIRVFSRDKKLLFEENRVLAPLAQHHVFLNQYIGAENVGLFEVRAKDNKARLLVQSFYYGPQQAGSDSIAWAYASQAVERARTTESVSFPVNTYSSAYNWLKLSSLTTSPQQLNIAMRSASGEQLAHPYLETELQGTKDIALHEVFGPNNTGSVHIRNMSSGRFAAQVLRVFSSESSAELLTIAAIPGSGTSDLRATTRGSGSDDPSRFASDASPSPTPSPSPSPSPTPTPTPAPSPTPTPPPGPGPGETDGPATDRSDLGAKFRPTPRELKLGIRGMSWEGRILFTFEERTTAGGNESTVGVRSFKPQKIRQDDTSGMPIFDRNQLRQDPPVFFKSPDGTEPWWDSDYLVNHIAISKTPRYSESETSNPRRCPHSSDSAAGAVFECYEAMIFLTFYESRGSGPKLMHAARARIIARVFANANSEERIADPVVVEARLLEDLKQISWQAPGDSRITGFEQSATTDGRLLFLDKNRVTYNFSDPFRYNGWAEPILWGELHSVRDTPTHIPGATLGDLYPIARRPMLDARGIPCGCDCGGGYGWISQDGSELFYTKGSVPFYRPNNQLSHPRRGMYSVVGPRTNWIEHHIDGPLNLNRRLNLGLTTSPGAFQTMWHPYQEVRGDILPYSNEKPVYPIVALSAGSYGEVHFQNFTEGGYLIYLPMNELVRHPEVTSGRDYLLNSQCQSNGNCKYSSADLARAGVNVPSGGDIQVYFPVQDTLVVRKTQTPDASGNFNTAILEGGAQFPTEYHVSRGTLPDVDGERHENVGFVGRGIYVSAGGRIKVPLASSDSLNPHCGGPAQSTLSNQLQCGIRPRQLADPERCNLPSFHNAQRILSFEVAVKPLQGINGARTLINRVGSFKLRHTATGALLVALTTDDGVERYLSTLRLSADEWNHIGVVLNGVTNTLTIYLNGSNWQKFSIPLDEFAGSEQAIYIGGDANPTLDNQNEYIFDEFAVSSIARSRSYFEDQTYRFHRRRYFKDLSEFEGVANFPLQLPELGFRYSDARVPNEIYSLLRAGTYPQVRDIGALLFSDPQLAGTGVSCATCHNPSAFFIDSRVDPSTGKRVRLSPGADPTQPSERHSPTILNRLFSELQFTDGSSRSLVDQVAHPIENPREMGGSIRQTVAYLRASASYRSQFQAAFAKAPDEETLRIALASFVISLIDSTSLSEKILYGVEATDTPRKTAIARGATIFLGKGRCSSCHLGPNFSDESFHNIGSANGDIGRFKVERVPSMLGAFKTPTLKNIAGTAPYFHDGSMETLDDVLAHYLIGGDQNDPFIDLELRPLQLSPQELRDLKTFLENL